MKKIVNFILLCAIFVTSICIFSNVTEANDSIVRTSDTLKLVNSSEWLDSVKEPTNFD